MLAAMVSGVLLLALPGVSRAASNNVTVKRSVPAPVATGAARVVSPHSPAAMIRLNVGVRVRNSARLNALIAARAKLTPTQYSASYAPTAAEAAGLTAWLKAQGLTVLGTAQDNLWVKVTGSTQRVSHAFGVTINDYVSGGRTFYSNDRAPVVPARLNVSGITGLDDYAVSEAVDQAHGSAKPTTVGGVPNVAAPYCPSTFIKAYDVPRDASGHTIGMVLWGEPLVQGDLDAFTAECGSQPLTIGAGADHVQFIPVDGSSTDASPWGETALDVENGHGIAPGSHINYYLASTGAFPSVDDAENAAVHDTALHVISNSWGRCTTIPPSTACHAFDGSDANLDAVLQLGASTGKTIYFASGDSATLNYPATSPNVVSVGGTTLNTDGSSNWSSETAWSGSGNGCSATWARPPWQTGVGAATCPGRTEPDVSADAGTAAWDCFQAFGPGAEACEGAAGTSLAAPLWAGMTAVWDAALAAKSQPDVGFDAPLLYAIAQSPTVACSAQVLHDSITSSASSTIEHWPGGQVTLGTAPCTVTVARPSGDIDLVGGTAGVDNWHVVSFTGYKGATISVNTPTCRGLGASGHVEQNRPRCTNASTVGESGHSSATADITTTAGGHAFHDITSGCAGNCAATGWDEVTGWGSPDLAYLIASTPSTTQTITFATVASHQVGPAPFTVTPTASSGLPVGLISNSPGVCTVASKAPSPGWAVTLHSIGTCSLSATQTGNATFRPAVPVTQTFFATGPNLVFDNGFELPAGFLEYTAPSKIRKWSVTAGSVDVVTNTTGGWVAAAGSQSLDLNGVGPGTIEQVLTLPTTGNYMIRFKLSGNPTCGGRATKLNVLWNGAVAQSYTFNTTGHTAAAPGWVVKSLTVPGTAGPATLRFASTTAGSCGSALDIVTVRQVS
jgi:pseudomonalisin/xanthomonalisin